MKRRTFIGTLLAGLMVANLAHAQDGQLTVGTDGDLKPFDFSQNGTYVGFDQDILAEISKEIGRPYRVTAMDFSALIPAIQSANIDLAISSIFLTDARKQVVDFSAPYYESTNGALIAADSTLKSGADLDGKRLASVTGTAGSNWIKANAPGAEVKLFPSVTAAILELQSGGADAVVFDYPNLAYFAKTEGGGRYRMMEESVGEKIPVAIAFPKGSELVAPVDKALEKIRADGRYKTIYDKWFGEVAN